jgi:hypothetical protein
MPSIKGVTLERIEQEYRRPKVIPTTMSQVADMVGLDYLEMMDFIRDVAPDFDFHAFHGKEWDFVHCNAVHPDGYIDQQITKLHADEYVKLVSPDATHVVHIDSDTVLLDSIDKLLTPDGRPYMLRTPYSELCNDARHWKAVTEKHIGHDVSHEYMRRFPLVYPIHLYAMVRAFLACRNGGLQNWVNSIQARELSEFNLLGAFAYDSIPHEFEWIDTDKQEMPPLIVKQFWSYGGVAPFREELEKLLCKNS